MITEPLLGSGQSLFDPTKLTWIGSASREDGLCVATRSSGITSWNDLLEKEVIVGTTAPGTTTYMYPVMLRNLFGARFKPVSGYPDGGQIALAVQRNEVQAICQTLSSIKIGRPDWLRDRVVVPLIALGLGRLRDLPDPQIGHGTRARCRAAADPQGRACAQSRGPPVLGAARHPPQRAQALRAAFDAMTRDASFLEEAQRLRMDIEPASGLEIEALVKEIYALPESVIARTKLIAK